MSENIAGYIDRSCIKGQIYKLAGCPKPVVAGDTVNINEISSSLLSKAVYATQGQTAGGDFPNDSGIDFLITTVEFGNNIYLQSAMSISSRMEYKRINTNGTWTDWKSLDKVANDASTDAKNADLLAKENQGRLDAFNTTIFSTDPTSGSIWSIANEANTKAGSAYATANGMSSDISFVKGIVNPFGTKTGIVSGFFSGTIDGYKTGDEARVTVSGYSSILGVIPVAFDKGSGAGVAIPFITEIVQPSNQEGGNVYSGYATIKYKLFRPASQSARYTDYETKFLVFGIKRDS